jgi:hypothetical protein
MGFLTRTPKTRDPGAPGRFVLALVFAVAACGPATESPKLAAAPGEWLEFSGTWNAAGRRHTISLGEDRTGATVELRGTLLLAGPDRPGVGFHSEVIGLTDSATGFEGRSVWTDEHGDKVFSSLHGEGTVETNHIVGTILSGTGRYAGATGTYEFSWLRLMESEDGSVQGRAVDLKGRVLPGPAAGAPR